MRTLTAAFVAVFSCLNPVYAETYVRGMAGTGFDFDFENDAISYGTRNGYAFSGAIGQEVAELGDLSFAVETEFTFSRTPIDEGAEADINSIGIMTNGLVRYDPGGKNFVRPYVGGGIGMVSNTFQNKGDDTHYRGLNWQTIGGVNLKFNRFVSFDVQYRYVGQDLLPLDDSSHRQHVAMAGITVCFNKCWDYW